MVVAKTPWARLEIGSKNMWGQEGNLVGLAVMEEQHLVSTGSSYAHNALCLMCTLLQSAHETQMRLGRPWLTEEDIWAAEQTELPSMTCIFHILPAGAHTSGYL